MVVSQPQPLQKNRSRKKNVKVASRAKAARVVTAVVANEAVDETATDVASAKVSATKVLRPKRVSPALRARDVATIARMSAVQSAAMNVKASVLSVLHVNAVMPWPHKLTVPKRSRWTLRTTP